MSEDEITLPPLQDLLCRIFDDARGSDMLTDALAQFRFESSREFAEAIVLGIAGREELLAALERIAFLRRAGDIGTAKNLRKILEKAEVIALVAIAKARGEV